MTAFRRTDSGLTNMALFLGSDAVVFVEGGTSYNREEVNNGKYTPRSQDIRFWQALFTIYYPGKKFSFRSVGSKTTVKSIAEDIATGRINNVITAMDRDFDHLNSRKIISTNVLYTKGYSWENDSWCSKTISDAYCALSGSCRNNVTDEVNTINNLVTYFEVKLKIAVNIDAILSQYNNSLFDRNNPNRYIQIHSNGKPAVNSQQIKDSLSQAKNRNGQPVRKKTNFTVCTLKDCFGHLVAEYCYKTLSYLLTKVRGLPKISKEYAIGMVVEKLSLALQTGQLPDLKQHYDHEFAKILI